MKTLPYGTWPSPITADLIAAAGRRLGDIAVDGDSVYWIESRPEQEGRNTIMMWNPGGELREVTPPPFNVRSRAHEYGGGAMAVYGGRVFFVNDADRQIYHIPPGGSPQALTSESDTAYADMILDPARQRLILVQEHYFDDSRPPRDMLAVLSLRGRPGYCEPLVSGNDFYASPALSRDGRQLCWLSWDHPAMPWNGTELWVAEVGDDGQLRRRRRIAGGAQESVFQPQWGTDGTLYFASDRREGWWNLHAWDGHTIRPVLEMAAEFALPQWVFGMSTYCILNERCIAAAYTREGRWEMGLIDPQRGDLEALALPFSYITQVRGAGERIAFVGAAPDAAEAVYTLELPSQHLQMLRKSSDLEVDAGYISTPQAVSFESDGEEVHGFFYPPSNRDFSAPEDEKPPLIVFIHGGPTAAANSGLDLRKQFWTSRGFAVLDVNYRGSTGYGRAYRESLNGRWGVADVQDCVNGARRLAAQQQADPERLLIRGGSAGGFTALAALTFHDCFRAGASYYGISDLEALEQETHKFESRYNHQLIAPYPAGKPVYRERSPLHHAGDLNRPVIFLQGLEDRVVPPGQAERMAHALRKRGVPVAYLTFEGEGHGFRKPETIRRALEAELFFYGRVLGFEPGEKLDPVQIDNL
ncbi:MAG: S9 family peptidase [Calditrichaeota bacterium]|nr:S9 family peptidase [Calditrichota bacterium]